MIETMQLIYNKFFFPFFFSSTKKIYSIFDIFSSIAFGNYYLVIFYLIETKMIVLDMFSKVLYCCYLIYNLQ